MANTTKLALEASLKELLRTKPIDRITINDLTEHCGISRMTFYYHFKDIYDLIEWAFEEEAGRILEGKKDYDTWQQGYLRIFEDLNANKPFIMNVYRSISQEQVEQYLYKIVDPLLHEFVDKETQDISIQDEDKQFVIDFFKYALVGMVLEWIRRDMKTEPAIMAERLNTMMHGDLKRALLRFSTDGRASKIDE